MGSFSAVRDTLEKSWGGQLKRLKDMDTALVLWSIQPLAQGLVRAARAMGMKVLQSGASQRGPRSIQPQVPDPTQLIKFLGYKGRKNLNWCGCRA